MIQAENLQKSFDGNLILSNLNAHVKPGAIYGLIGSNGAGKSTLLNLYAGIYKQDGGTIRIDGSPVYENPSAKAKIAYVSDDPYLLGGSTLIEMAKYYDAVFDTFSMDKFRNLVTCFPLDPSRKINTFSKGMRRQAAILLGLSQNVKILLCDESFDGLDQAVRQMVKRLFINEAAKNGLTVLIASHNLPEMEDLCDTIAILHEKQIILEKSMEEIQESVHKIQVAFKPMPSENAFQELKPLSVKIRGNMATLIVRGELKEIEARLSELNPLLIDVVDLTLEEIFIHEMEVTGYDFSKILL